MKTLDTIAGKMYVVMSPNGGTVTSADGLISETVEAGKQKIIIGTGAQLQLDDAAGKIISTFNSAPAKLRLLGLLGGGASSSALPAGYLAAEWLGTDTGEAYITVPLNKTKDQTLKIETEHYATEATQPMMEGSKDKAYVGAYAGITPGYLFVYFTWAAAGLVVRGDWNTHVVEVKHEPCRQIIYHPTGERVVEAADRNDAAMPTYTLFRAVGTVNAPWVGKKRTWKAWLDGKLAFDLVPAISPDGQTCMYNKVTKEAYSNIGAEPFIVGMTCKQALKLAELPDGGGELTVSLPWEAQLIASGVPEALQIAADKGWFITVQYRDPEADSALYNRYAECVTIADMQAVNADYKNDLTPDGEWIYPTPKMYDLPYWFSSAKNLKKFKGFLPSSRGGFYSFNGSAMTYFECDMPGMTDGGFFLGGCPLTDYYGQLPNMSVAPAMFAGCELNKASVVRVSSYLKSFTSGNHPITLGIHVDNQTDEEVAAAIADAESRGWTVTVQWNGTATAQTASTFGLRRKPVYAKLGSMTLPDGTVEQYLDWGHYVTSWEENGYQEFVSVEEAKEYFNIGD